MILLPSEPDEKNLITHRLVSENGVAWMGIFPVFFGYRVRAGLCSDRWGVRLDWCGGGKWPMVQLLYSLTAAILRRRPEDEHCFDGLPGSSAIKPYYRDEAFVEALTEAAGAFSQIWIPQPKASIWEDVLG